MISYFLVYTCLNFMRHEDKDVRREATMLLGSLLSLMRGRQCLSNKAIETGEDSLIVSIADILGGDDLDCREVVGWMLVRLTSARDGVEILTSQHTQIIKYMIISFMKYTKKMEKCEGRYIVYLLESMANVMFGDEGIEHYIGTGVMQRLSDILKREDKPYEEYDERIRYM